MSNTQGKSRKGLIVGIIAAVAVLAVVLVLLLTQCTGGNTGETTVPPTTEGEKVIETYDLYWNVDRAQYAGMSEAGMSSRMPEDDGYFHVRFFHDGEIVTLKVADRKVVNALEVRDLMGLTFDDNGIVTGILALEELPCEQVAWQFYVQSAGGKLIKANSSASLNGMEVLIETGENTGVWDMTGLSGDVGCDATPIPFDRILAVANGAGEVTHVFIYSRDNYMRTHEAECEHCGKVVEWSEWTKENAAPSTTGHYVLMNDIKMPTNGTQISMAEDQKICLDLNGKRIDGTKDRRVYSLHNVGTELAIMDTSEEKTGTIAAHGKGDQGMCVWLRYGVVYLYDGILDGSDATTIKNGTTVALQSNTYMYMHGGEIIGGTSMYVKQDNGKYNYGLGGTLSIANKGKFVMNDGVIRDGEAKAIVTKRDAKGQPSTYERGYGGNIFMSSGSVFEMNGGTIKNGTAGNQGGNILLDGTAEFTMNGGKITGGKITGKGRNGGNISIASKATFTMNGGYIQNGQSRNCAGNIYHNGKFIMNGGVVSGGKILPWGAKELNRTSASRNVFCVNGTFEMRGGKIDGGVQAIDTDAKKVTTSIYMAGYCTIASEEGPNLTISGGGSGVKMKVGSMYEKAKVGVSTTVGIFTRPTKESNLKNFYSDIDGADVVYYNECLALGKLSCQCGSKTEEHLLGCSKEQLFWGTWTTTDKLPTTTGNYYLLKDVNCGQQNVAGDAIINLDLNGHRVDGKSGRIYSMHFRVENVGEDGKTTYEYPAHLTITDTSEGRKGVMASHGTANHQGSIAWLRYGDVTLLAGTFDASDYKLPSNWNAGKDGKFGTSDDTTTALSGGAFAVDGGHTLTMYGGTIIGGETIAQEQTKTNTVPVPEGAPEGTMPGTEVVSKTVGAGYGGAIAVSGNFYMYGGTVRDGVSGHTGGNIRINGSGKMYMYGGTVTGGTSTNNGGNIIVVRNGLLEMNGGEIVSGWSKNVSGNIHVDGGTLTLKDGYIGGGKTGATGTATSDTANVFSVNGTMNLSGGEIAGHVRIANYNTDGAVNGAVTNISGNPVISAGSKNIILAPQDDKADDGKTPTMPTINIVGAMTEGADIKVALASEAVDFATGKDYTVTAEDAKAFAMNGTTEIASADTAANSLFFGRYNCLCGKTEHTQGCQALCGGEAMKWYAWSSTTTLPTTGNVYLANNVSGTGSTTVKSNTTLNLDLNGKTVSWKYRAYRIYDGSAVANATLTITNTAETEGVIREVEYTGVDQGCAVWVAAGENGVFNLLDGVVLDGSKYTVKNVPSEKNGEGSTAEKNGGVVAINTGGTFNMYGGTIIGATAIRSEEITLSNGNKYSSWAPNGAAVAVTSGNANMYGGEIRGGNTNNQGGNLLISGGKFNMSGGVISGGYAGGNGGNVFVHRSGELNMSGNAIIRDGETAGHSGNVMIDGKMTMTGNSTVSGGTSTGHAGSITVNIITISGTTYYGSLAMSGNATITGGEAAKCGGNIRILSGASLTMTDNAVISEGTALDKGGNIYITDANAKMTMQGKSVVKDGEAAYNGGNIHVAYGAVVTVKGEATISGGTAKGAGKSTEPSGGNVSLLGSSAKLDLGGNAKLKDGKSYHTAGNIRVSSGGIFVIRDNASVTGGMMSNSKGDTSKALSQNSSSANIFNNGGTTEFYGGTIDGNVNVINASASNASVIKMAGNPVITKGVSGFGLLSNYTAGGTASAKIQVTGAMTGEAGSIVIGCKEEVGIIGQGSGYELTDADAAVFVSDGKGTAAGCSIIREGNTLIVGGKDCLCGQDVHTKACLELWNGEERTWIAWNGTTTLPTTTGNYYLTGNVDLNVNKSYQQKIGENQNVVIDLNGYTVLGMSNTRAISTFNAGGVLTITDKSDAQTGTIKGQGNNSQDQGILWVRFGTVNLVAGTIDGSEFSVRNVWNGSGVSYRNGGCVAVDKNATFNMYGGTIIGAKAINAKQTVDGVEKDLSSPQGGAMAVSGTFNMYGGTVRDGVSSNSAGNIVVFSSGVMNLHEGATVSGGSGYNGGSMSVEGTLNICGGTITGGTSTNNGGNIRITTSGTVNLSAGTVENGWGKNVSGNFHVDGGRLIMTGGEIKGGRVGASGNASASDANINSVKGKLELLGGTIDGGILIQNYNGVGATTKLGGNVVINKYVVLNHSDGYAQPQLEIAPDYTGSVKVYAKSEGIITTNAVTEAQAAKVTTSNTGKGIYRITDKMGFPAEDEGKLYLGQIHCVCGASKTGAAHDADICDGTLHIWQPTTSIVDSDGLGADQYYYFTADVKASSTQLWGNEHNVTYDMNGFNLKNTGGRVLTTYSSSGDCKLPMTFTIVNTGTTGSITVSGAGDEGRIAWLRGSKKTVNIYNVDINISAATGKSSHTVKKDGIAFSAAGWSNNVNLYKVNVVGGTSASDGNFMGLVGKYNKGLIKDSTITGCSTAQTEKEFGGNGGAIWVNTQAELTLNNTTVTGCEAKNNGGAVYVVSTGKLTITGNTKITGNTVGGKENNVYLENGAILEIGTLGSNAQVGLSGANGQVLSTEVTYSEMEAAFSADSTAQQLAYLDSGLTLQDAAAHIHCVCGGTIANGTKLPDGTYHYCKDIIYTAYSRKSGDITANTNGYLTDELILEGQPGTGVYTLNLCLNGHNITTSANSRMFRTYNGATGNGKITVTTCTEKEGYNVISQKERTGDNDSDGGIFWITNSGTLELYAGTIDASKYTLKPNSSDSPKHGCAIHLSSGSTLKIYGGTIIGGKTLKGTSNNSEGACIFSQGTIIMNGGTIIGGETVGSGGSIFAYTGAVTKIYGGTIKNGKAGNNGGNIFHGGSELLIAGGTIQGGTAGARGGNVYFGTAGGTISGGTISGGEAKDGGNIANNSNITFTMTGGTITGGNSLSAGGNVWLMGPLKMSGGLIEKGTNKGNGANTGANICMNGSGALEMTGGTIKGRISTAVAGAKVNLSGSAKIYETDTSNNLYILGFDITIGQLNSDAKIGMLILKNDQVGATVAKIADGVTIDPAQFPVHDLELTNSSTRSFKVVQEGTALKIVEVTK